MFIILFPIAMRQIVIFAENSREAAKKVAPFYEDKNQTEAVKEIIQKADASDGYPGLGYLKKLSVKNHLELILSL